MTGSGLGGVGGWKVEPCITCIWDTTLRCGVCFISFRVRVWRRALIGVTKYVAHQVALVPLVSSTWRHGCSQLAGSESLVDV